MELTQVQIEVPLLPQPAPTRSNCSCFHWLSFCSFALLLVATTVLALLHFQIIPTPGKQAQDDFQFPEVLHIQKLLDVAPNAQAMKGQRVAAHLIGKPKGNQIEWEFTPMNTFKDPELILKKNSLQIPQKGLYFVYTQVVYTGKDCKTMKSTELTHTVMREGDYGEPTPILTSTKTACDVVSGNIWHQPIYQGGIFLLEEGDILSTETTKINLLNMNKGQVYFGVIAL